MAKKKAKKKTFRLILDPHNRSQWYMWERQGSRDVALCGEILHWYYPDIPQNATQIRVTVSNKAVPGFDTAVFLESRILRLNDDNLVSMPKSTGLFLAEQFDLKQDDKFWYLIEAEF